jgi:hypothetical protein
MIVRRQTHCQWWGGPIGLTAHSYEIEIRLRRGRKPEKIWLAGPSSEGTEVDEKVLEDLLASFF